MNAQPLPRECWTARRWIGLAIVIFAIQAGALFLLGKNHAAGRKVIRPAPVLTIANNRSQLALDNPTLFALPNQHGFSAAAWLKVPVTKYQPSDWSEPQRWLEVRVDELGTAFRQLIQSNQPPLQIVQKVEPEYALPRFGLPNEEFNSSSTFRIEGELANRLLLSHFELRSWTNAALLTNSVVQFFVNAAGFTRTTTLLVSSGFKEADETAIALSKAARFEPLPLSQTKNNPGRLTLGQIVFEWRTTLMVATNRF